MAKRHSIKLNREVCDKVFNHCQENNISMSKFLEDRIREYLYPTKSCTMQEHWTGHEPWILTASYKGERDFIKDELIQISVGRRGATSEHGLSFIFDESGASNKLLAKESKKRIARDVHGVEAKVYRIRLDHGMG